MNETSVTGNEDSSEELKNAAPRENPENGGAGEVGSGADAVESFVKNYNTNLLIFASVALVLQV